MSKSHIHQDQAATPPGKNKPAGKSSSLPDVLEDAVEEASNESFPASDPPAFTHTSATRDNAAQDSAARDSGE